MKLPYPSNLEYWVDSIWFILIILTVVVWAAKLVLDTVRGSLKSREFESNGDAIIVMAFLSAILVSAVYYYGYQPPILDPAYYWITWAVAACSFVICNALAPRSEPKHT